MPNTKSAKRMVRTSEERRVSNQATKSVAKSSRKRVLQAVEAGDKQLSTEKLRDFYSATDKAVKKGVLSKNTAARQKARTAKRIAAL